MYKLHSMHTIVKTLSSLKGIQHACFCPINGEPCSTFPEDFSTKLETIHNTLEQMYAALEAVDKHHNETYWVLDKHMLVSFNVENMGIFILLTDKKINFPLVTMGIKSATAKLKKLQQRTVA